MVAKTHVRETSGAILALILSACCAARAAAPGDLLSATAVSGTEEPPSITAAAALSDGSYLVAGSVYVMRCDTEGNVVWTWRAEGSGGGHIRAPGKSGGQSSSGHMIVRTGSASSPGPITALSVTSRETPPISA